MRQLNFDLKELCQNNRDGSHSTRANRHKILQKMANDLHDMNFRHMRSSSLKEKHVKALVNRYQEQGLSIGTLKNRLSVLRWWSRKVNRSQVVAKTNAEYGTGNRQYVTNISKGKQLDKDKLEQITCPYIRISLELQAAFGLRREEAIKVIPKDADQKDHIKLAPTWCKGGKARTVHILTEAQREILGRARQLANGGSLIPESRSYKQQMNRYEKQCNRVGFNKMHGLRHAYAEARYEEMTGWPAPACGGPTSKQLTQEQKQADLKARLIISKEMGHEREGITANYLGR